MAESRTLALISLFESMNWDSRMNTLSKNETVFVLTGEAIALAIRTRTNAMGFIANDALSLSTKEISAGSALRY